MSSNPNQHQITIKKAKAKFSAEALRESELLSTMLHKIGHEIGNPLTSIISLATIIDRFSAIELGGLEPEKTASYAQSIVREAWRISGLTEKLVLLLSAKRGAPDVYELPSLVQKSLSKLKTRSGLDSDWFRLVVEGEDTPKAYGDADQLTLLISELLENGYKGIGAAKNPDAEPPELPPIIIRLGSHLTGTYLQVETPVSQPAEHELEHLLEPLVTTHGDEKHLGLGLPLAASIAVRHGGELELEERQDENGVIFITRVLLREKPETTVEEAQIKEPEPQAQSKPALPEKLSILVVEDESTVASAIKKILALELGNLTSLSIHCLDGEEALELIESDEEIDIILCDLNLAGMSGRHVFDSVQELRPETGKRFAFITGDSTRPETETYLKSSARPYLHKPFEAEALIAIVYELLTDG